LSHPYIPNDTANIIQKLLKVLGLNSIDDLFLDIPSQIKLKNNLLLPESTSEAEVRRQVEGILNKNITTKELVSFLGGGVWHHYVPSAIDAIVNRGEFLTSYTPYQPEISQGILQSLFEYQSMMAELLAVDVVNSSMYDWASALGEACRMASRITHRKEFLVPHFISPGRLATLKVYADPAGIKIQKVSQSQYDGQILLEDLQSKISSKTAGIYIENPSYLGFLINNPREIAKIAHDVGSLFVVGVEPTSLGIIKPPGQYGADIVIGEGQPLGNYINYGGPLLGIFACKHEPHLIRQMPGRLVGMTTTHDQEARGFCMVLQTREQHIRRERATSNICTNHALCALRAALFMALMGRKGFKSLSEHLLAMTQYTIKRLSTIEGIKVPFFNGCHYKDFTVTFVGTEKKESDICSHLLNKQILGGKSISPYFPELGKTFLWSVTEMHTRDDVEAVFGALGDFLED
jgi:glycine dehydrogenase subunit 1